jgi:uncharacterized membrane protein YeaQ/YmgE (transglycosylase-associated protein family)
LLANMLLPGKRSLGLIFTELTGIAAALGGGRTVSRFREERLGSGGQMPMIFTKEEPA